MHFTRLDVRKHRPIVHSQQAGQTLSLRVIHKAHTRTDLGPRSYGTAVVSTGIIQSLKEQTNETITRNHVQESARENDQPTRDDLQTSWHADLLPWFFKELLQAHDKKAIKRLNPRTFVCSTQGNKAPC
jgi:hypothetical protein